MSNNPDGIVDFLPKEKNRPGIVQHEGFTLLNIVQFDSLLNIPLYEFAHVPAHAQWKSQLK